jgi:AcrR family transcriptional regulator
VRVGTRARQRLLDAASDLFYAEGIQAVGVEKLIATSGIGRASFYRHFASKDELVAEVLRRGGERWRDWLANAVHAHGGGPLAVFDALAERFAAADYRGCLFNNSLAETSSRDGAVFRLALEHNQAVLDYVDGLVAAEGRADHAALAAEFLLLIDGAMVTALRERTPAPAHRAKAIATRLLG